MPKIIRFFRAKTRYAQKLKMVWEITEYEGCDMNVPALHLPPLDVDSINIHSTVQQRLVFATQEIVARGWYMTANQATVSIAQAHAQTRATTRRIPVDALLSPRRSFPQTVTMVHNQTALTVAAAWYRRGYRVALVNATPLWLCHPATIAARMPDNALLFASGIADCVIQNGLYRQRENADDALVVTPQWPVFRTDVGDLLARPWYVDAITTQFNYPQRLGPFLHIDPGKFQRWFTHVIQTASGLGANVLVVNISMQSDAELLAQLFAQTLTTINPRGLAVIDFAIPDINPTQSHVSPFWYQFAGHIYYH